MKNNSIKALLGITIILFLFISGYQVSSLTSTDNDFKIINYAKNDISYGSYSENTSDYDIINFISNHQMFEEFVNNHLDMEWYLSSYDNRYYAYGYTWSEMESISYWISIQLEMKVDGYAILSANANDVFGDPTHNFNEIVEYSETLSETSEFLDNYPNSTLSINLSYNNNTEQNYNPLGYSFNLYYGQQYFYEEQFAVEGEDTSEVSQENDNQRILYSDTCLTSYGWLDIIIEDETLEIFRIAGTTTANLEEEDVIEIVETNNNFSIWLSDLDYMISASYSGYGTWWINIYGLETMDWGYARINDTTGEIIEYYIFIPVDATKTEQEILDIALTSNVIEQWITNTLDYDYYLYYDYQGNWYVYLYDTIMIENYAYLKINDTTGNIEENTIHSVELPNLSLNDVFSVLREEDLGDFLDNYPEAKLFVYYYDNTWSVYVYSPIIVEASIYIRISDNTGNVIEKYENHPRQMPEMSTEDVFELVESKQEYINFTSTYSSYDKYTYYYDRTWYVYLWSNSGQLGYASLFIEIDDTSQQITDTYFYEGSYYGCYFANEDIAEIEPSSIFQPETGTNREEFNLVDILSDEYENTSNFLPISIIFISTVLILGILTRRNYH